MSRAPDNATWPSLPLEEWRPTRDTLWMWMQIVGKTRLALGPAQNHWWHVALHVTSRGLTTTPIPYGARTFQVDFDLLDHRLIVDTSEGTRREIPLGPRSVADFYRDYLQALGTLGLAVKLWPVPVEADHSIPFDEDRTHAAYDAAHAHRFFRVLMQADRILKRFAGRFLGKSSPVHFFWGAFDLALTRFSGRRITERPAGESRMMREANSHEEMSVGFWPGSGAVPEPAFYAYARPEPPGLSSSVIAPPGCYYSRDLADFILPWEHVRTAASPDAIVLEFCQSAYDRAATLARWDRDALDRPPSEWP